MTENKNNAPAKSMPEKKMSSGVVMLYNRDGGFGFVRPDAGGKDLYFSIHEVEGTQVPKVGDKVEFTVSRRRPRPGKALPVECLRIVEAVSQRNKTNRKKDERIECPHCGRMVVPRISFYHGSPDASYCPFCAGCIAKFGVPANTEDENWTIFKLFRYYFGFFIGRVLRLILDHKIVFLLLMILMILLADPQNFLLPLTRN